jgi:hypothetical protein
LYHDWTATPGSVLAELDPPGFTLAETAVLEAWGEAQRPWGLRVRLRRDYTGAAKLAEVLNLDDDAPLAILYHAPAGRLRVDDFSGEVHTCRSLNDAQQRILEAI